MGSPDNNVSGVYKIGFGIPSRAYGLGINLFCDGCRGNASGYIVICTAEAFNTPDAIVAFFSNNTRGFALCCQKRKRIG